VLSWLGGFFYFGGCTWLEDSALAVFPVVLLCLGVFFCGALVFFLLLVALALPSLFFRLF
jgi:hypothetical protein